MLGICSGAFGDKPPAPFVASPRGFWSFCRLSSWAATDVYRFSPQWAEVNNISSVLSVSHSLWSMSTMSISGVWSAVLGDVTHLFMQIMKVAVSMLHSPTVLSNIHLYDVNLKKYFLFKKQISLHMFSILIWIYSLILLINGLSLQTHLHLSYNP